MLKYIRTYVRAPDSDLLKYVRAPGSKYERALGSECAKVHKGNRLGMC